MSVRFAPSPTGRFHIGNLRTAWVSHRIAKKLGLPWILRFEDIDGPRVVAGAREQQLADMAALGLTPDGVDTQSSHHKRHASLFGRAVREGQAYPCFCSRKDLQRLVSQSASAPHEAPPPYDGHCRDRRDWPKSLPAQLGWRFRGPDSTGKRDFIVGRTTRIDLRPGEIPKAEDFLPAYNWACGIDDYDGAYRVLVRASDLANVAELQRDLQTWIARVEGRLTWRAASLFHAALVTLDDGSRLEKRTKGVTLPEWKATTGDSDQALALRFERSFKPSESRLYDLLQPGATVDEIPAFLRISELS